MLIAPVLSVSTTEFMQMTVTSTDTTCQRSEVYFRLTDMKTFHRTWWKLKNNVGDSSDYI
jgi:hypothetical protein